jgi:TP901 family phage tail tape measure protein
MQADVVFTIGFNNTQIAQASNAALSQVRRAMTSGAGAGKQMEFALGRITGKANEFQKSLDASAARVVAFGATAGVLHNLSGAFKRLLSSAIEVEHALTEINTLLTLSSKDLAKFSADLFRVANQTGQSFLDAAKAAQEFSRQGLTMEQTLQRTKSALTLTRLSGLALEDSVSSLTATMNSFRREAISDIEIVNRLANVDAKFAVSSADLAEALKRVGGAAADAGIEFNKVIALVTAAQQQTARGGSVIGNSLKTIFTRLQRPAVLDDLEAMGIAVRASGGETLDLIQILQNLSRTYDSLSSGQKSFVTETVGGVYQINILKAVLGDISNEAGAYKGALEAAGEATASAEVRMRALDQTLTSKLKVGLNDVTKAFAAISKISLEPVIRGGLDAFGNLTKIIGGGFSEEESQGVGESIARNIVTGFGKGIGNLISGPGVQFAIFGLIKLFQR